MNYATAEAEDNREKILKFIVKYIKRHCYPPATYEIAADTGLSKATVRRHIAMLLEDRILETEHPRDSRAYRIKDTSDTCYLCMKLHNDYRRHPALQDKQILHLQLWNIKTEK